ncbi:threonine aspartase [Dorcoceras hygrometricum]|uniref:Threonine aspartase n=1 Tax=Dorcoceras hygrometricum TaxID=472368 RepID=A0A2Z7CJY3_9LAMI|nr:threonine aspartase [Dorcoceras hygrometricum]
MAGNDGNSPEKLTAEQCSRVLRTEVYNREIISLSMGSGANTPAADFLALTQTTSPQQIQTMAYCTSLQELAANRYHPFDASQNVIVLKSLALSAESTYDS